MAPAIEETRLAHENVRQMVERLAEAKAKGIPALPPGSIVIGSDQMATLADKIVGKPGNHAAAAAQLQEASGKIMHFHTGLCVWDSDRNETWIDSVECLVKFRTLTTEEIDRYLLQERPYDCAGSFKSEGYGITLLESITGGDATALIGLPLIRLCAMLRQTGFKLP
jgi:septum formation protein